jgi:hypothetical protein
MDVEFMLSDTLEQLRPELRRFPNLPVAEVCTNLQNLLFAVGVTVTGGCPSLNA